MLTHPGRSRREFLARAGAATTMLPFLRTLLPRNARAAAAPPRRLILLMESNGTLVARWRPTGADTSFTLPADSMLAPLETRKTDLLLVEPLSVYAGFGDQHFRGYTALWTGVSAVGTDRQFPKNGGMSIDQYVAPTVSAGKRYPVLNLSVMGAGWRPAFARGPEQSITPDGDPYKVYARLFAGTVGTSTTGTEQIVAERRSVLDAVAQDLQALSGRLAGAERAKMEAHLTAVRSLENSLTAFAAAGCQPPALDQTGAFTGKNSYRVGLQENFAQVEKMMGDTLLAALACDLTRVVTFEWGASNNGTVYSWLGHKVDHHAMSHDPANYTEGLVQINQWLAGRVGYLMDALKAVPEAGGGTMLDNTLIVWGNELGVGGPHRQDQFPLLMAGGRNLGMKVGRYLKLPSQLSTNAALVTILRAMGLPDQSYGDPQVPPGVIPGAI